MIFYNIYKEITQRQATSNGIGAGGIAGIVITLIVIIAIIIVVVIIVVIVIFRLDVVCEIVLIFHVFLYNLLELERKLKIQNLRKVMKNMRL